MSDLFLRSRHAVTLVIARNKAVAIGAVSYYIDHFVTARISRFTYGLLSNVLYNSSNPEHVRREHKSFVDAMGDRRLPDSFVTILARVRHAQPLPSTLY